MYAQPKKMIKNNLRQLGLAKLHKIKTHSPNMLTAIENGDADLAGSLAKLCVHLYHQAIKLYPALVNKTNINGKKF